jgi:hypothetical protein
MDVALTNIWQVSSFDAVIGRFAESPTSFTENEALKTTHWDLGEDALLREDARFRLTPWGRWILASHLLANEMLYRMFREVDSSELALTTALAELQCSTARPLMICPNDPRFVLDQDHIRLASTELSNKPKLENPTKLEKYVTHLPLHTLKAVAASEPAGEWGPSAQEELIETKGWLRVRLPGHKLNDRMFVAEIKGHSMDNGRSGLIDGAFAVFELWPSGTKQGETVLVRGAFSDPETGSYAVKRYQGDIRDSEGRHRNITLVSLNPDKERYPDIVLAPEQDDDLAVVAKLIDPLAPGDYGREPKQRKRSGERDISSPEGQRKIEERLTDKLGKFFDGEPKTNLGVKGLGISEDVWSAQFICLDPAAGGLHLEAGPLTGLPPFVKKLQVVSGSQVWPIIASNFRTKSWRVAVSPSLEPYQWSAPGIEDILDEEFSALSVNGLSTDVATLFRIDAAGVGLVLSGLAVSLGQSYRLLVPPGKSAVQLPEGEVFPLDGGWRLWELSVPSSPDKNLRSLLEALGVAVGKSEPAISWVIVPPALYRTSPSGESYPCFHKEHLPIFSIQGIEAEADGELKVFLSREGPLQALPLPKGETWTIEFVDLQPGRYMFEVLHTSASIEAARLPFAVESDPSAKVSSTVTAIVDGVSHEVVKSGSVVITCEDSLFDGEDGELSVFGPPMWPVTVSWESGRRHWLNIRSLERDGSLNIDELVRLSEDLRKHSRVANLVIDFRELGRITLRLDRQTDPEVLSDALRLMVHDKETTVAGLAGQFPLLRSLWLDQLLLKLNYRIGEFTPDEMAEAPPGTAALKLYETSRSPKGEVREELRRVMIITTVSANIRDNASGSARGFAEEMCWKHSVVEALITDGLRWFLHKRGSKMSRQIWDLRELIDNSDDFDMEGFLSNCAVGV